MLFNKKAGVQKACVALSSIFITTSFCFAGESGDKAIGLYTKTRSENNLGVACKYCKEAIVYAQNEMPSNYDTMSEIVNKCRNLISDFEEKVSNAKNQDKIILGMSKNDVISAWGKPSNINRDIYPFGTHEQWVYGSSYVYFENDVLTAIQSYKNGN